MTNPVFPGVPRIESPLFAQDSLADLTATEQVIARDLNTHGFAVLDFPDPDIEARIERIKANLGPRFDIPFGDRAADKTRGERRVQDGWKFDDDVRAIASNPQMLNLLGKLYGRAAFPFQTLNFPVGTQQAVHSDSVHFSSLPERFMCGIWLAMEDVAAGAGPLFYVRGSHRWPIVTNAMIGRRGFGEELNSAQDPFAEAWKALCRANGAAQEPFLARKGQALIWTANLLHGGSPQTDPTLTRWSQVTHYFFDDCIYYTPAFSDECIGKLALRDIVAIHDGEARPNRYLGEGIEAGHYSKNARPKGLSKDSNSGLFLNILKALRN
ncbi:MAG: phytanoyl-CoA dioxygenase [Alphaproteobacteria bacterium HGW-Alphaproteobacteria-14]|nr:MAG: phytanoyl-CoA dioxygenase [Alphaproteobacteria bacterium HGW-Alphaproteobacteria-14]